MMETFKTVLAAIGFLVGIPIIIFVWYVSPPSDQPQMSEAELERAAARRVCRDAIEDRLHDPGSAEWEPMHRWVAAVDMDDESQFLVQTDMRARNAMGGMVRTTFQCVFAGRGENMRLIRVSEH